MDISAELTEVLRSAIKRMVEGRDVAVAFSGGLDSGIVAAIAKEYARSVRLYTAGVQDAYDVLESCDIAEKLGLEWEHILISEDDLAKITGLFESYMNLINVMSESTKYYALIKRLTGADQADDRR